MDANEIGIDMEPEVEDKTPQEPSQKPKRSAERERKSRKKGGFLGKFIALFLGLILGIVAGIGGLGGIGYYFLTKKTIKQTSDTVASLAGIKIPLVDYITDEYADKNAIDAVEDAIKVIKAIGKGTGTLNDLKGVSPKVEDLVTGKTGLVSIFDDFGIALDAQEVMKKKLLKPNTVKGEDNSYFTDYLRSCLQNAPAGDLLKANNFEGNQLIDALVYGEEGEDYDIVNGEKVMKPGKAQLTIGGLMGEDLMTRLRATPLDSIMDISQDDEMMCALAYGPEHRYTYDDATDMVIMNQMVYTFDGTDFFDDTNKKVPATVTTDALPADNYLLTFEDESTQLVKLVDGEYKVFTNEEEPAPIKYEKTRYGDLEGNATGVIDRISLPSVLGVEKGSGKSHAILEAIAFDEDGNERTLGMFKDDNQSIIDSIKLSTVLNADTSSNIIMYMLYGRKNVHWTVETVGGVEVVKPLQQRVAVLGEKVFNAYGEQIQGAVANGTTEYTLDGVTYTLTAPDPALEPIKATWEETVDSTKVKHEETLQAYYVSLNGDPLMYEETSIGSLKDGSTISKVTDRLQLNEFIDVSGNRLLKNIGDTTIANIPTAVNNVTIEDVFGDTFYYRAATKEVDEHGNEKTTVTSFRLNENDQFIDKHNNVVTGYYLSNMDGTKIDLDGDDTVMTREEKDLALSGSWKYILRSREEDEHGNVTYKINHDATVMDMDGIMNNMMHNVHDASVRELQADDMVQGLDNDTLNQELRDTIPTVSMEGGIPQKVDKPIIIDGKVPSELDGDTTDIDTVGDLTIEQLLKYTAAILSAFTASVTP